MSFEELQTAVQILASVLTQRQVVFGIMGGAGIALIASHYGHQQPRATADIDLVVETDDTRDISAYTVSETLISQHPDKFGEEVYGVAVPAIRLRRGQEEVLVDVEIFDYDTWRTRPAFNLANPQNIRIPISLGQYWSPFSSQTGCSKRKSGSSTSGKAL